MNEWWSQNLRRVLQVLGTVLAVALLAFILKEEGWDEIIAAMRTVSLADLLLVGVFFSISRLATAARWHILLRSAGIDIRFRETTALTLAGLFASNFLPTTIGGDVVRLAGALQMNFDRAVCLASLAADRLIGMFGMSMAAPLGLAYSWSTLFGAQAAAITLPVFFHRTVDFIKRTLGAFSIWLKKPASLLLSIAGLWSLTYFITLIPISINGYGVQELSFTFLMSNVAGLAPAASLIIAVLIRAYFLLSSLPGAAFLPSTLAAAVRQKGDS
jgi:uncharacterized membrane protein YbhN (UPF0104 family)